jgi:hypothetical protein
MDRIDWGRSVWISMGLGAGLSRSYRLGRVLSFIRSIGLGAGQYGSVKVVLGWGQVCIRTGQVVWIDPVYTIHTDLATLLRPAQSIDLLRPTPSPYGPIPTCPQSNRPSKTRPQSIRSIPTY